MNQIDWPSLMAIGFQRLKLAPADFWALTPAELMLMAGQGSGARPLGRSGLEALVAAYPDLGVRDNEGKEL